MLRRVLELPEDNTPRERESIHQNDEETYPTKALKLSRVEKGSELKIHLNPQAKPIPITTRNSRVRQSTNKTRSAHLNSNGRRKPGYDRKTDD